MKEKKQLIRDPETSRIEAAWLDETCTRAAHEMVGWLKSGADTRRPIDTLSLVQMKALAATAWSAYIGAAAERRYRKSVTPEEIAQMDLWLG